MTRQPISGKWARARTVPYANAAKWGTGIHPVHAYYGSDALRIYGRPGYQNRPDVTPPSGATPDFIETGAPWGYCPEDLAGLDVFADQNEAIHGIPFLKDDLPAWGDSTPDTRDYAPEDAYHPWGSPGFIITKLRSRFGGPRNINFRESSQLPTETVSEGWRNKPKGTPADAEPSDDSQIFVQTSMIQRYETRVNVAAVTRGTDDARSDIGSRVVGQRLKVYSGEERHYDMFPFQQDEILRPFWYRTAGVDDYQKMEPNSMFVPTTLQRTPPPDPTTGTPEIDLSLGDYGYTSEDTGYY